MAKKRQKLGWVRWTIIILMLLVMFFSISLVVHSQLPIWESEQEIHTIVEVWREQALVPNTQPKESEPDSPTSPAETKDTTPETEPDPLDQLKEAMKDFNREIYVEGQTSLVDAFSYQNEVFDLTEYGLESGLFGVISVPKINIELPLYLGASYEHLSYGFAQLSQTSFPIGGNNTNSVVACHRGWRGMAFMRDCELLSEGDSVFVENPWETLEYRLVEVRIIEPHETENILIEANRDLLTIVTCHPYGVGSHRYLLICERYIPEEEPAAETQNTASIPEETEPEPTEQELIWGWTSGVKITTSDGSDFESSQETIFWQFYFPWICLIASIFLMALALVIAILAKIISFIRRRKKKTPPTEPKINIQEESNHD